MNQEKIKKFFQVATDKTKSGTLTWKRAQEDTEFMQVTYIKKFADEERSFLSEYGNGRIVLLAEKYTDSIRCYLLPDADLSYQQIGEDNDPLLLRLYNVVYAKFPSVESFIDSFISDP